MIRLIESVIKSRKLRYRNEYKTYTEKNVNDIKPLINILSITVSQIKVFQILVKAEYHEQRQREDKIVADPDHPPTRYTRISPVDISEPVEYQKEHGSDSHHEERRLSLRRKDLTYQDKDDHDRTNAGQNEHYIKLNILQ